MRSRTIEKGLLLFWAASMITASQSTQSYSQQLYAMAWSLVANLFYVLARRQLRSRNHLGSIIFVNLSNLMLMATTILYFREYSVYAGVLLLPPCLWQGFLNKQFYLFWSNGKLVNDWGRRRQTEPVLLSQGKTVNL